MGASQQVVFPLHSIIFSDTDNDVACVTNTLDVLKLRDKKGRLCDGFGGIALVHTGDLLDKNIPDPEVLDFWEELRSEAQSKGGSLRIIAGNHELEAWQAIQGGETFGLSKGQLHRICEFIERLDILAVEGSVLLLHGYPTLAFLRTLEHFTEVTGEPLNRFNDLCFRPAFNSVKAIRHYAYLRGKAGEERILCDVEAAAAYFRQRGRAVADLLKDLGIDTVIHGHRPQRSGVQADNEFGKWLPGIRMIGNDTKVRQQGLGATLIRAAPGESPKVAFLNTKANSGKSLKKARALLASAAVPPPAEVKAGSDSRQDANPVPTKEELPSSLSPPDSAPETSTAECEYPVWNSFSIPLGRQAGRRPIGQPLSAAPEEPRKSPVIEQVSPEPTFPSLQVLEPGVNYPDCGFSMAGGHSISSPIQAEDWPIKFTPIAEDVEARQWPAIARKWIPLSAVAAVLFAGLSLYWLFDSYQGERARLLEQIAHERAASNALRREIGALTEELTQRRGRTPASRHKASQKYSQVNKL